MGVIYHRGLSKTNLIFYCCEHETKNKCLFRCVSDLPTPNGRRVCEHCHSSIPNHLKRICLPGRGWDIPLVGERIPNINDTTIIIC